MSELAIISLGSNKGDWELIFHSAHEALSKLGEIDLVSQVYKTEPWGVKNQPWFKNQIIGIKTILKPITLLEQLLTIETINGRNRPLEKKWGQRSLDLDIIYYGNEVINCADLAVPHPHLQERNFILQPLLKIYPSFIHPILQLNTKELIKACNDTTVVKKIRHVI